MTPHRLPRQARLGAFALVAALAAPAIGDDPRGTAALAVPLRGDGALVRLGFHAPILALHGVVVDRVTPSARQGVDHPLSIVPAGAPAFAGRGDGLELLLDGPTFVGFTGGSLQVLGGFRVRRGDRLVVLDGFSLVPGDSPYALWLLDGAGTPWLAARHAQWQVLPDGRLHFLNADLRVLPGLAHELGDDRLAGITVGALTLAARTVAPPPARPQIRLATAAASPPCYDWSGVIDVGLVDIDLVQQVAGADMWNRVVITPSVRLKNVGTANVPWYRKFSVPPAHHNAPYGGIDQHPFLVWQMARDRDGVLTPLGRSDLKHAFATGNEACMPDACRHENQILGLGCEDLYPVSSNIINGALGPRAEVTASTGVWAHCSAATPGVATHFDGNADCIQEHTGSGEGFHFHGMKVDQGQLAGGGRFFVEAFYVIREDVDVFDTMGWLSVQPTQPTPGGSWFFPLEPGVPYRQGPLVDGWVDPSAPGPRADNRLVATAGGRLQLAVRVSELPGGRFRYAWALHNLDFDRRISTFHVPFEASVGVSDIYFADGDRDVADWQPRGGLFGVAWDAPAVAKAPLDWGSFYSFQLESDQPPTSSFVNLTVHEPPGGPGDPTTLRVRTLVPARTPVAAEYFTVAPCRLFDSRAPGGGGPLLADQVRRFDVPAVAACGIPDAATAVAVNVTAIAAGAAGHLTVYPGDLSRPPRTSTVSFGASATRANNAISGLAPDGTLALHAGLPPGTSAHTAVDVVGYFVEPFYDEPLP